MECLIERTSRWSTTTPAARPSHSFSPTAQPHMIRTMITATDCQKMAVSGLRLNNDCFPATNQSSDATTPPKTQCLAAKSENTPMMNCDYSLDWPSPQLTQMPIHWLEQRILEMFETDRQVRVERHKRDAEHRHRQCWNPEQN